MRDTQVADPRESRKPAPACPACRSADVTTASKVVTVETYWRCVTCGEVWNVMRRESSRDMPSGSWRR